MINATILVPLDKQPIALWVKWRWSFLKATFQPDYWLAIKHPEHSDFIFSGDRGLIVYPQYKHSPQKGASPEVTGSSSLPTF
jgi:hypothetical protein